MTPEELPEAEPASIDKGRIGTVLELIAMVLASAAGFAAPTDWNVPLGLVVTAACLFATGFFALGSEA